MKLSALIQKNGVRQVANANPANPAKDGRGGGATLAGLATLALASPVEPENGGLAVTVYSPAGLPVTVFARDANHAAWLRRMNPKQTEVE